MRRKDAAAVAKMMLELAAFHGDVSRTTPQHFIDHCLGAKKLGDAWIAFVDKKPAGFAVTYDWMNFVRVRKGRAIDLLYVKNGYRGQGIGAALIAAVAKDAVKKGIQRVNASAQARNKNANAFYKSLGFERSHPSNRYGIDGKALKRLSEQKDI